MKKLFAAITLLVLLAGSVFAKGRTLRVTQKIEEGNVPQIVIKNYDTDSIANQTFDIETMTNYFVTIYTNKNGVNVKCRATGKNKDSFDVVTRDVREDELIVMFIQDFDKTWWMIKTKSTIKEIR